MSTNTFFGSFVTNNGNACSDLNLGGTVRIQNLATPTASDNIATESYVSNVVSTFDAKASCKYATTGNISDFSTKATVESALDTISASVPTLVDGDRVLVKNQTTQTDNGIYSWNNDGGVLQRADDHDGTPTGEVSGGNHTFVEQGDTLAGSSWVITGDENITIGVSNIVWVLWTGSGTVTDHTQLTDIGTNTHAQIDTHIADSTIHYTQSSIDHDNIIGNGGAGSHTAADTHIADTTGNPHSLALTDVTPTTTKGDIYVHNGTTTTRLGVGTNGQALTADSTQTEGVAWKDTSVGLVLQDEVEFPRLYQTLLVSDTFTNSAMSGDGTTLVLYDASTSPNVVRIWERSGETWSESDTFNLATGVSGSALFVPLAISDDGTYIAVGRNVSNTRSIIVYRRTSPGVWADDTSGGFNAVNNGTASSGTIKWLDMDSTGEYLAVGAEITTFSYADVWQRGANWSSRTNRFAQNENVSTTSFNPYVSLSYGDAALRLLWKPIISGNITIHLRTTSYNTTPEFTIDNNNINLGQAPLNADGSEFLTIGDSPTNNKVFSWTRSGTTWTQQSRNFLRDESTGSIGYGINDNKYFPMKWSTDGNSIALLGRRDGFQNTFAVFIYSRKDSSSYFVPLQKFNNPSRRPNKVSLFSGDISRSFDRLLMTDTVDDAFVLRKGTTHWIDPNDTTNQVALDRGFSVGQFYYDQTGQVRQVLDSYRAMPEFCTRFPTGSSISSRIGGGGSIEYYYAVDETDTNVSSGPTTMLTVGPNTVTAGDWMIIATIVYGTDAADGDSGVWWLNGSGVDNTTVSPISSAHAGNATAIQITTLQARRTLTAGSQSYSIIWDDNNGFTGTNTAYYLNIVMYKTN